MYTLLYLTQITDKVLLYSIWNSAQYYVVAWLGGEIGGRWRHAYIHHVLGCTPETITTLLIGYTPLQNKKVFLIKKLKKKSSSSRKKFSMLYFPKGAEGKPQPHFISYSPGLSLAKPPKGSTLFLWPLPLPVSTCTWFGIKNLGTDRNLCRRQARGRVRGEAEQKQTWIWLRMDCS